MALVLRGLVGGLLCPPRVSRERPAQPHIQIPRNQQLGKERPTGRNELVGGKREHAGGC